MEKRTTESILNNLKELVESKRIISPTEWVDAALFLEILKFDENEKTLQLKMIAKKKYRELRRFTKNAKDAEIEWETTQEYEDWQRQELKTKEILEFVRIAKKEADIRSL